MVIARLREALSSEDWGRSVALVGAHWPRLLDEPGMLLDEALRAIPLAAFAQDARAAAVRDIRLHTSADEVDRMLGEAVLPDLDDFAGMDEIARSPSALNLLSVATARMIALRVRGRTARALQLAELVERYGRIAIVHQPALLSARLPAALLHAGITRGLADDIPGALLTLRDAYERGPDAGVDYVEGDAAGKSALFLALEGDVEHATRWLRRYDETPKAEGWLRPRIDLTAEIARTLVATEALRKEDADLALSRLDQPMNSEQGWGPGVTFARARYALAWGDRLGEAEKVRRDRERYAEWLTEGTTFGPLLQMAESDLLLALGRVHPARRMLSSYAQHPLTHVARARVELAAGDYDAASRHAATGLNAGYSTRARTESLAVQAVTALRRDGSGASGEPTDRFTEAARLAGLHLTALSIPQPVAQESDADPGMRETIPHDAEVVKLTAQQMLVLHGLEQGLTLRQIGAREHLSVNTMKTHASALYRRLGAANRDDAIARAYAAGLL